MLEGGSPESVEDLRSLETHWQQLSAMALARTVAIEVQDIQGSGVLISADGYVLTAAHVAGRPGRRATVIFSDGRRQSGMTLGTNETTDAGLIKLDNEGPWPFAPMGDSDGIRPGHWVLATGHPNGYVVGRSPVVRLGRLAQRGPTSLVSDCTLISGDSGGPLFDMHGQVVGIHSRIGNELSTNIHVPIKSFQAHWERLVRGEVLVGRGTSVRGTAFLGVTAQTDAYEARVDEVRPNSPAEAAGFESGDIILHFDGRPVNRFSDLVDFVSRERPGTRVSIEVRRGTRRLNLLVTLRAWGS